MRGRVAVMDLFWGRYIVCGRQNRDGDLYFYGISFT